MPTTNKENVILITGGAGFIGCRLAQALGDGRGKIVAVDNLHPQIHPGRKRPTALPEYVELIVADVLDAAFWDGFLAKAQPRLVVHLAAETGTGQSLTESTRHASVNVVGTTQMLDAFTRADFAPEHILLASSRAVYGEGAWRTSAGESFYPPQRSRARLEQALWDFTGPSGAPATPLPHRARLTQPRPSSVYGATKLSQEHIILAWAGAMKTATTILRFQNVYGPGQSPFNPYTGIVMLFHRVARAGKPIDVYEDGQIGRDFVFIDDVERACVAAIENPPSERRCLDVGTGEATTIERAARLIADIHQAPQPQISGKFRDGDIRWAVADTHDLAAELGVRSRIPFEEGARQLGEWLVAEGLA